MGGQVTRTDGDVTKNCYKLDPPDTSMFELVGTGMCKSGDDQRYPNIRLGDDNSAFSITEDADCLNACAEFLKVSYNKMVGVEVDRSSNYGSRMGCWCDFQHGTFVNNGAPNKGNCPIDSRHSHCQVNNHGSEAGSGPVAQVDGNPNFTCYRNKNFQA